jgi:hypothetical protein
MANEHIPKPGTGVAYYEPPEKRRSEKAPDFQGFITLEMDYKAGEKLKFGIWEKQTRMGTTLLSLREDNYSKKMNMQKDQPTEVTYRRPALPRPQSQHDHGDEDVPF